MDVFGRKHFCRKEIFWLVQITLETLLAFFFKALTFRVFALSLFLRLLVALKWVPLPDRLHFWNYLQTSPTIRIRYVLGWLEQISQRNQQRGMALKAEAEAKIGTQFA